MHQTLRLNVDSAFLMTRALVPAFKAARYGKVVNVASLAAFGNFDHMGNAAYDAAKPAVIGLTHTLSRSLGRDGIRVNVVAPGSVYTERVQEAFSQEFLELQRAHSAARACRSARCRGAVRSFADRVGPDQRGSVAGHRRIALASPA